jgi:hypothetical protein
LNVLRNYGSLLISNELSCFLILHSDLGIIILLGCAGFGLYRFGHLSRPRLGISLCTVDLAPNTWNSSTSSCYYSIFCEWSIQAHFGWRGMADFHNPLKLRESGDLLIPNETDPGSASNAGPRLIFPWSRLGFKRSIFILIFVSLRLACLAIKKTGHYATILPEPIPRMFNPSDDR